MAQSKPAHAWFAQHRARRIRALLFRGYVLITLLAFAALAFLASTFPVFQPDVLITRSLQSHIPRWFGYVLQAISLPGYALPSTVITLVVVAALAIIGLRWEALAAFFAAASSQGLNYLIKAIIHRPRPASNLVQVSQTIQGYSFPSGHVMYYIAFFGFLLFLTLTLARRTWWRSLLAAILLMLIVLVGISRIYVGEHWASDVLGGYCLGSLNLPLVIQFYRWGKNRRFLRNPIPASTPGPASAPSAAKAEGSGALQKPLLSQNEVIKEEQSLHHD